jgi:hypothetical protein
MAPHKKGNCKYWEKCYRKDAAHSSQIYGVFINKYLSCSDMLTTPTSTDNNEESRERQKEGSCKLL